MDCESLPQAILPSGMKTMLRRPLDAAALPEADVRARLAALPPADLARVLTPREREALDYGYRERVTDLALPHIRDLPAVLPGLFADAAARAREVGFDGV